MAWNNNDGLYIKYGTEQVVAGTAGEYRTDGPQRMVEVSIGDLTALTTTGVIQDDVTVLPKNARIEKVELVTTTAVTSGGLATLDIGIIDTDRSTAIDDDGLIVAGAIDTFNAAGETVEYTAGTTAAGALIGTTLAANGYIVASYNTAAFTAGAIKVRIYFSF